MFFLCRLMLIFTVLTGFGWLAMFASVNPWVLIGSIIAVLAILFRRKSTTLSSFGTARWANEDDLRGLLGGKYGLSIGQLYGRQVPTVQSALRGLFSLRMKSADACDKFLAGILRRGWSSPKQVRLSRAIHTAVISPTGGGKGVSFIVPFLQECRESCVVVDFKGELAKLTARHRRKKFGHKTVILDPFKQVTQTPDTFNPLDFIGKSDEAIDECRSIAESQVIRTGQEKEPHWNDAAESWIAAFLAGVVQFGDPDDRSLQSVRDLLSSPAGIQDALNAMETSDAFGGMLKRMSAQLRHFKDKELGSTMTTVNRHLRYLDTPAVAASTKSSSFNPADLLKGRMTVYLVLPPEHMRTQSALLRLWIGSLLRAVVRGGLQERNKVHFVLDEAATLGHLEAIDDAVDKFRGYGVRLLLAYQSLGQLRKCFPEGQEQTLLSNVTQIFMGTNDWQTAEYIGNRLGDETIIVTSGGSNRGGSSQTSNQQGQSSNSHSWNGSDNWSQNARKLLQPSEVLNLHPRTAITFTPGSPPICTWLTRYYEKNRWSGRALRTLLLTLVVFAAGLFMAAGLHQIVEQRTKQQFQVPVNFDWQFERR
jgi:type IV secretion system protein VirD4